MCLSSKCYCKRIAMFEGNTLIRNEKFSSYSRIVLKMLFIIEHDLSKLEVVGTRKVWNISGVYPNNGQKLSVKNFS